MNFSVVIAQASVRHLGTGASTAFLPSLAKPATGLAEHSPVLV